MAPTRSWASTSTSSDPRSSSPAAAPYPSRDERQRRSSPEVEQIEEQSKRKPSDSRVRLGKHIARTVNVKFRSALVLNHGIKILSDMADRDDTDETEAAEPPKDDPEWDLFNAIINGIPGSKSKLIDEKWVADTARFIDKGASTARSDDVSSLKKAIVDFLPMCHPPIHRTSKLRRGFHHPFLGSLLCPSSLDWSNDQIRRELREEITPVKHTEYPPFMYRNYEIDPEDLLEGLFESSVLLKAARHIFVSPSSAEEEGSRSTRAGNALLNGMTRITPAAIAYVTTQVRFALSSDTIFGRKLNHSQFDLYAFYDNILTFLNRPEMAVRTALILDYWTENVFGVDAEISPDEGGGTASAILAQLRGS
ncbi:hypothetical protein FS837_007370 [Tulasnella sp. UAMH 9824]|nr:hypothetical protein FS837_007370 [Tulasnella sp. UAMH 9824]